MEKEALIKASSEDLFGKLQAVIQYLTSSTKVTGPWRRQLVIFMLTEVHDKLMHAQLRIRSRRRVEIRAQNRARYRQQKTQLR
jgi:hypothetical protein